MSLESIFPLVHKRCYFSNNFILQSGLFGLCAILMTYSTLSFSPPLRGLVLKISLLAPLICKIIWANPENYSSNCPISSQFSNPPPSSVYNYPRFRSLEPGMGFSQHSTLISSFYTSNITKYHRHGTFFSFNI